MFLKELTLVDFILLAIFFILIASIFNFFYQRKQWIELTVFAPDMSIIQAENIRVNNIEKSSNGNTTAVVTSVERYISSDDPVATSQISQNVYIKMKILVGANPRSGEYLYKNKLVKIGLPIQLQLNSVFINGSIFSLGKNSQVILKQKRVTFHLTNFPIDLAGKIKVSDGEYDNNQNKILEVTKVTPINNDLYIEAMVSTEKHQDLYLYRKSDLIAPGNDLTFFAGGILIRKAPIISVE